METIGSTVRAIFLQAKEAHMNEVATTAGVTLDQITKTVAKIEASISDWEHGRMTSPDDRDHVIEACEVLGVDWHKIDRDTDNDIIGKIANEIYEDSGETLTDVNDLATFILTRLFQEGLRPVTEFSPFVRAARDLNENLYDSFPSTDEIVTEEEAEFVLDVMESHAKALREARDAAVEDEPIKREFLIHVNVQIECEKDDIDVETVQREIAGALEVGLGDMSHTPHLQGAEVEIALAEEI